MLLYERLDSEILDDAAALRLLAEGSLGEGNLVMIGQPAENMFSRWMLSEGRIPGETMPFLPASSLRMR